MSQPQQMSTTKLIKTIDQILDEAKKKSDLSKSNQKLYRKHLTDKYLSFFEAYPHLFNAIIDDPEDFEKNKPRLYHMLNMKRQIEKGKITHEEASTKIGQEYYDEFVKPKVNE